MSIALRFGPPLALMGLIYFLSGQPNLGTGLGVIDLIGRKIIHLAEYALLWFLWWRAFGYGQGPAVNGAVAIAVLYAVSDEWHQSTVEGRNGTPVDVVIDAVGVALAVAVSKRWERAGGDDPVAPGGEQVRPTADSSGGGRSRRRAC